jgi:metal-sulfur cluster biosynthetic enzyme
MADQIMQDAKAAVSGVEGVESCEIDLSWDPPWTPERIAPLIRSSLGL